MSLSEGKRVLAVDDDPDTLQLLKITLEHEGYLVDTANDGLECLEAIEAQRPDAIILDMMMPNMNGAEVARTLKQHSSHSLIPIIVLTALSDKKYQKAALWELGVDFYVVKPVDPADLLDKIREAIVRKKYAD